MTDPTPTWWHFMLTPERRAQLPALEPEKALYLASRHCGAGLPKPKPMERDECSQPETC